MKSKKLLICSISIIIILIMTVGAIHNSKMYIIKRYVGDPDNKFGQLPSQMTPKAYYYGAIKYNKITRTLNLTNFYLGDDIRPFLEKNIQKQIHGAIVTNVSIKQWKEIYNWLSLDTYYLSPQDYEFFNIGNISFRTNPTQLPVEIKDEQELKCIYNFEKGSKTIFY